MFRLSLRHTVFYSVIAFVNIVFLQVAIMIGSSVFKLLSKYTSVESFMRWDMI